MPPFPNNQNNPAGAIPVWIAPAPGLASSHITTAIIIEIKDEPGTVIGISINTGVAGKTIKLYDGDPAGSGVLLGTWSAAVQNAVALSIPFSDSLYGVIDGTADITVSYI